MYSRNRESGIGVVRFFLEVPERSVICEHIKYLH
jgi:hypothetical protein